MNVWNYGLMRCGEVRLATLCARLLDDPRIVVTNARQPATFPNVTGYFLPGTAFGDFYQTLPIITGATHFPYGLDVEPDEHG